MCVVVWPARPSPSPFYYAEFYCRSSNSSSANEIRNEFELTNENSMDRFHPLASYLLNDDSIVLLTASIRTHQLFVS